MEQYISKSTVIAEIEKRISLFQKEKKTEKWSAGASQMNVVSLGARIAMLEEILSFFNTLEVKEVDLEEKATQLSQIYFPDEENIWARSNIEAQKCKSACIEMVECLKAQKGE